jgi:hypothetical protein
MTHTPFLRQIVVGFVLSGVALSGMGIPVLAQGNPDATTQKGARKKAKTAQGQQTDQTVQPTVKRRAKETTQQEPVEVRRRKRDTSVNPDTSVQANPENRAVKPRTVNADQTAEPRTNPRRNKEGKQTEANTVRVEPRVDGKKTEVDTVRVAPRVDTADRRTAHEERRVSDVEKRKRIDVQRRRYETYNTRLERQNQLAQQRIAYLKRQNRQAQLRYQEEYWRRVNEQRLRLATYRSYDYDNDPYYYTAPSYRYYRGGRSYYVNQYSADLLNDAVRYGYQEGFEAGRADREDHVRFNYRGSFAWEDANYGYPGHYIDQSEYNYYFREGFRRGYEDGYYSRSRYGSFSTGKAVILAAVVGTIITLAALD